ncbi:MAG: lipopolysaccharide heptosyltransferase II [Endomicrobiaceae bacterium]|nr:lipopolysaccharide heptosyltransferase II [Endomicrobiaceae bacterium]
MNKLKILSFIGWIAVRIIGKTFRIRKIKIVDIDKVQSVCAFWHGDLITSFYVNRNKNAVVMISMSKDGEIQANVAKYFGYIPVRGSSSRGGNKALAEIVRYAKEGYITGFAVDGPKGPIHKVKPGVLFVSQTLGIPVVPICAVASRVKILEKSWDKFKIPMPFSKVIMIYGSPIKIGPEDNLEEKAIAVEDGLNKITDFANDYAWTKNIKDYLKHHPQPKILIIQPSRMGDVIFALPAVNAIKKQYPHAHISWIVDERCAGILKGNDLIDDLIIFDRTKISLSYVIKFYKQLRKNGYDLSIDFHGLFKSAFIVKLAGARFKLASSSTNGMRELSWLFSKEIKPKSVDSHCIERHLAVAKYLGCPTENFEYGLNVAQEEIETLKKRLEQEKIDLNKKIVAIHPGGGWISRRWQTEKFAQLIDLIKAKYNVNIVLVGGKEGGASEKGLNEEIISQAKTKDIIDLTGKLQLKELMAFLKICNLFIANEAGPMHIATALNTNAIAILGPTNAKRTGPFKGNTVIMQKKVECQPCRNRQCIKVDCMNLISVEEVFESVVRKLGA